MEQIISTRNLFIDSSADVDHGDNFSLHLGSHQLHAGDGQLLRITLMSFDMPRNFYGINVNNSKATLVSTAANATVLAPSTVTIPSKNYARLGEITAAFADVLKTDLLVAANAAGSSASTITVLDALPASIEPITGTGDRIMSFSLVFDGAHGLSAFAIQCHPGDGETYRILGGDRIDGGLTTSLACTVTNANTLKVQGLYPMQRTTEHHVFLRTDLPSTNIESASLSQATGPYDSHTLGSNIFAMLPLDVEYVSYESQTASEYTMLLTTRQLSAIKLYLTDSKNRPLGRVAHSGSKTAAGSGTAQSTLGNLSFRAMIRLDVVQVALPGTLQSRPVQRTTPAKSTGVLNHLPTT